METDHPSQKTLVEQSTLRFATRVDRWLAVVAAGYVLLALGIPAWHLGGVVGGGVPFNAIHVVLPLVILGMLWAVTVPCYYELRDQALVTRSGIISFQIPLLAVTGVRRTCTVSSAPAWSFRRLEIRYGKTRKLLISPEREMEFLSELKRRAPQLEWIGDELAVGREWLDAEQAAEQEMKRRKPHSKP